MNSVRASLCAGLVLTLGAGGFAVFAGQRDSVPLRALELPGTYELVDRVLDDGKVLRRPDIAALYTSANGRANFNLFVRNRWNARVRVIDYSLHAERTEILRVGRIYDSQQFRRAGCHKRGTTGFFSLHSDQEGRRKLNFCSAGRVSDYDVRSKWLYRGH
jgi:hypothetical protein